MNPDPEQKVKTCPRIESGLRLGPDAVRPCVFSVFESPIYWPAEEVPSPITKADIVDKRKRLFEQLNDQTSDIVCKTCLKVETKAYKDVSFEKLGFIDLAHYSYCNLRCDYCGFTQNDSFHKAKYSALDILEQFKDQDVELDSSVDFNGGEPSILPDIGQYLQLLRDKRIRTRMYSNAVVYSQEIEDALRDGTISWLIVSVDAGTRATFSRTKLRDHYETVVSNIRRYSAACDGKKSGQVASKYIFTMSNYGDEDIHGYVDDMLAAKPHQIWLLYDFQDFDRINDPSYDILVTAYAKMFAAFQRAGISPLHFYESFLDPVVSESRELVRRTKAEIKRIGADPEPKAVLPSKKNRTIVSDSDAIETIKESGAENLLIAPANITTEKIIEHSGKPEASVFIADRCTHKAGRAIGDHTILHYSDLAPIDYAQIIITSRYHFNAILAEIMKHAEIENSRVLLVDAGVHKSL